VLEENLVDFLWYHAVPGKALYIKKISSSSAVQKIRAMILDQVETVTSDGMTSDEPSLTTIRERFEWINYYYSNFYISKLYESL
jgi:hypothetical protein